MWRVFILDPRKKKVQYKLTYRAANHKDVVTPWIESDDEQIIIRDPYPNKRTLSIAQALNWAQVERAFVDVSYEDKTNRVSESQAFEFSAEDRATKIFSVDLVNPENRLINYKVTTLFLDGRTVEAPRSSTRDARIIVTGRATGHRVVAVRPVAADFARKKAKTMKIELRYLDEPNGLISEDAWDFDEKQTSPQYFEFDYVEKPSYEYRTIVRFANGLTKTGGWQKANLDDLVVAIN
jgi:hypothetical protein